LEKEQYLKYTEDEYENLVKEMKKIIINTDAKKISEDISYESIEDMLFETIIDKDVEYFLDYIYKNYSSQLFDLKESIFTSKYSLYVKRYYTSLLILLFSYTDYNTLVGYYEDLESLYIEDINLKFIEEKLLSMIQEKNLLDIEVDKLSKKFN